MSEEKFESEITCPHCGYEYFNSWEFHLDEGRAEELNCDDCGEIFYVEKNTIVNYRTWVEGDKNG